jgi:hypothetical protein
MDDFFGWKKDEFSNEHWQQIKLHFPPSTTFFLIYIWSCIYSIFTTLYAMIHMDIQ